MSQESVPSLKGKTVALLHPAWHSCGSHQVFLSQVRAYRGLGARVFAVALNDLPATRHGHQRRSYLDKTADLQSDEREWTAMPPLAVFDRTFVAALRRRLHGDAATLRVAVAARTPIPPLIEARGQIHLIHCNHFFCMPLAKRLAVSSSAPIILDSHDIQARQYKLGNESIWTLPPTVTYEEMLQVELALMSSADLILHLNAEENETFRDLLPKNRHALLFPAVAPVTWTPGGRDFLLIAASNPGNVDSVEWLLRNVAPSTPDIPFRIVGSVGSGLRRRAPSVFKRHASLFTNEIDDIGAAYRQAAAIVLPTVSGHGISIKTIEALSSGAPIVATPLAFRGMGFDPKVLSNVTVAGDPQKFAAALNATAQRITQTSTSAKVSDSRALYDRLFAPAAYQKALATLAGSLLS